LTSLSPFMLIGFDHEREAARKAALQALLVTGAGGLALLAGLLLLGMAGGSLELSTLLARGEVLRASPLYLSALILILLGAFTKSAQFPFHFWLPNAMEAPTPVSAYLHSATMVKAGVYLLARLNPALGGTDAWLYAVGGIGAITMLTGGFLALARTDLKRLLAYSTVSALGTLTMLIGLGTSLALEAAVVLLLAHALYKGALFLVAGALDHEAGTREITRLGGLRRAMPLTAAAAGIAALSMAGLPPLFGFFSKELVYETALEFGPWVTAAVVTGGLFTVFVAGLVGIGPFWGKPRETPKQAHEAPLSIWLGPAVLAGLSLLVGLFPNSLSDLLISPAVSAVSGKTAAVKLTLWHGVNPALLLSAATLLLGGGLYAARQTIRQGMMHLAWSWGPAKGYEAALDGLLAAARAQTRLLQSGYLPRYMRIIVLTATALTAIPLIRHWALQWPASALDVHFYELGLGVLILLAALWATLSPSRLGAVAALGAAGYGVALIYLLFGAPDLAMIQFLIESLTVILFVLAFYHLPPFSQFTPPGPRLRDVLIALLAGGLMTALTLSTVDIHPESISAFFVDNAAEQAHGLNVVNVILVDFRSLDTLGEITVLGIAAVGVYALLKFRKEKKE